MDRFSHLPDFIVHHILSFLNTRYDPPKELVRMSVLSKTWFHLTASFPDLYFDIDDFISRESFFKYVEYTTSRFCHQNLTARRLTLITTIHEPAELDVVTRCLELVIKNGVEELVIDITDSPESLKYRLPNTLLSVSVLKLMNIGGCELPSSLLASLLVGDVKFKSLIVLKLRGVSIDDEVIKHLSIRCPLLQTLVVIKCNGLSSFCVSRHPSLRCVRIDYNTLVKRIDIEAPNLSYLDIIITNNGGAPQMNMASCKRLANVSYGSCAPPLRNLSRFTDFLSNFPFVENFRLMAPSKGNNLKLSSHSLRRLMVHSVCNLEDIELSTPNLDLFVYSCSLSDLSMVRNIAHLKASMRCYPHDSADTLWFHRLRLFMGKESGFKALNLYIRTSQKFTELGRLKAIELPPYKLEHVELQLDTCSQIAFVDAVLWCFRPRILTLISSSRLTYFEGKSELLMFTYKKLLHQEDQGHTNIKIVHPSLLTTLPHEGKAISFIKEEVLREAEHTIKSSRV